MQTNSKDQQNFIKNLLAVAPKHCDNCGSRYQENDFRIVKSSAASTVLHLKCHICNNAYMLNVMNPVNGMVGSQRTPVNIDLRSGDEIQKFAGKDPVSRNEAIDAFNKLDSASREDTFKRLFS